MTEVVADACAALARVADETAADGWSGRDFLVELGRRVAGIPTGWRAWPLLAVGGRSRVRGRGFRADLDDGSRGQARHFAGTARAVTLLGDRLTHRVSVSVRRDPDDSPDGRLTLLAIEFAAAVLDGSLPPDRAGAWIRTRLGA